MKKSTVEAVRKYESSTLKDEKSYGTPRVPVPASSSSAPQQTSEPVSPTGTESVTEVPVYQAATAPKTAPRIQPYEARPALPIFRQSAQAPQQIAMSSRSVMTSPHSTNTFPELTPQSGTISQQDRRQAAKFAKDFKLKSEYRGTTDTRSIRSVLRQLKQIAETNAFGALEYQFLLNSSITERIRKAVPDIVCHTFEALEESLYRRVQQLMKLYGSAPGADRLLAKHAYSTFRQRDNEKLPACIERFEEIVADLHSLNVYEDENSQALQFIEGLNNTLRSFATSIYLSGQEDFPSVRNRLLAAERMEGRREQRTATPPRQRPNKWQRPQDKDAKPTEKETKNYEKEERAPTQERKPVTCNICGGNHYASECKRNQKQNEPFDRTKKGHSFAPNAIKPPVKDAHSVEIEIHATELRSDIKPEVAVTEMTPPEITDVATPMTLQCRIADSDPIDALIDTGATCALISNSFANTIAPVNKYPRCDGQLYKIHFANTTVEQRCQTATLPLTVISKGQIQASKDIPFLIVEGLRRPILLGRSALCEIGITLRFANNEKPQDKAPTKIDVEACAVSANQEFFVPDDEAFQDQLYRQPTQVDSGLEREVRDLLDKKASGIVPSVDNEPSTSIKKCLDVICDAGWLQFADRYSIRLQRLKTSDVVDSPGQEYSFVVRWTLTSDEALHKPWNSQRLISGLDQNHKEEWDEHVNDFQEKHWWRPYSGTTTLSSTVFPVIQKDSKTTRTRPCADMRILNAISPRVSAKTYSVSDSVMQLRSRATADSYISQYDLKKAFYRIKTQVHSPTDGLIPIVLKAGNNSFISDRLIFGLSVGPAGLNSSQFIIAEVCRHVAQILQINTTSSIVVMDDFLFIGSEGDSTSCNNLYEQTWTLTGFEFKKKIWNRKEPVLWLGQHWDLTLDGLRLTRTPINVPQPPKWTKRQAFKVAGKFTCLTLGIFESLSRAHADQIRQIAGKWSSWDQICEDKILIQDLEAHRRLAIQLHNQTTEADSNLSFIGSVESVTLETDASQKGYGWVLKDSADRIICCDAKLFPSSAFAWHANRRELFALTQALVRVDSLGPWLPRLKDIRALTDSRVAAAHADQFKGIATKALERKVILRLRNTILELGYIWKTQGIKFHIEHLPGVRNVLADTLSRTTILGHEAAFIEVEARFTILKTVPSFKRWVSNREVFLTWRHGTQRPPPTTRDENIWTKFLRSKQSSDPQCQRIYDQLKRHSEQPTKGELRFLTIQDGLIIRLFRGNTQIWIPEELCSELLTHLHVQTGHAPLGPLLAQFYEAVFNPQARKLARRSIRQCKACEFSSGKTNRQQRYEYIHAPSKPFEVVGMDIYGPLQRPSGARKTKLFILTIVDRLTGYCRFILMENAKAETVVREFECFCLEIGTSIRVLITDNGPQFAESDLLKGLCLLRGITHVTTPLYAPWSGGFYERKHRVATQCLRTLLAQFPIHEWKLLVATAQARVNSQIGDRSSSPHTLIYGWQYLFPSIGSLQNAITPSQPDHSDPLGIADQEAERRSKARDEFLKLWNEEYAKRQEEHAKAYERGGLIAPDERPLAIGDYVYFVNDTLKRKFAPRAKGPFMITEQAGKNTWWIRAEDAVLPFKAHTLSLRLALGGKPQSLDSSPSESTSEDENIPQLIPIPPPGNEVNRNRPRDREQLFLNNVPGRSRRGRLRRGRLLNFRLSFHLLTQLTNA